MSDTTTQSAEPRQSAKIIAFPTLLAEQDAQEGASERRLVPPPGGSATGGRRRTLLDGQAESPIAAGVSESFASAGAANAGTAGSPALQRLALLRRLRHEGQADAGAPDPVALAPVELGDAGLAETAEDGTAAHPSVTQLLTWLLNVRRGGVGFLYWNAAKLPIDVALMRAARLDDAAVVDVVGHRIFVAEPLRPRLPAAPRAASAGALHDLTTEALPAEEALLS